MKLYFKVAVAPIRVAAISGIGEKGETHLRGDTRILRKLPYFLRRFTEEQDSGKSVLFVLFKVGQQGLAL